MSSRALGLLIAGCLCFQGAAAEAKSKPRVKRVAPFDLARLAAPADRQEQLRQEREARWTLGDAQAPAVGDDVDAVSWRLRGATVKMKMPLSLFN